MADSLDSEGFGLRTNGGSSGDVGTPPPSLGELERQAAFTRDIDDFLRNGEPQSSAYSQESAANAPDDTNDAYSRAMQANHLLQVQGFLDAGNGRTGREFRATLPGDGVAGAILGSMPGRGLAPASAQGDDSWQYDGKRDSASAMVFPEDKAPRQSGRYEDNPLADDGGFDRVDVRKSWEEEWPGPNAMAQAGEPYGSPQGLVKPVKSDAPKKLGPQVKTEPTPVSPEEQQQRDERERWLQEKGLDNVWLAKRGVEERVNSPWGWRIDPNKNVESFHYGIDIHNPVGGDVRAGSSGTVVSIKPTSGGGSTVILRHSDGSQSIYMHTKPSVKPGQYIVAGRTIGYTDMSGDSKGPHIHFARQSEPNGPYVDPTSSIPKPNRARKP